MTTFHIEFDRANRYRCRVAAASPQEAITEFWRCWDEEGDVNEVEIDSAGPTGLSIRSDNGNWVPWPGTETS